MDTQKQPEGPPTITAFEFDVTLVPPSELATVALSYAIRMDSDADAYAMILAYGAAALASSWPEDKTWPATFRPRPWRPGIDTAEYGHKIYDALRSETKATVSHRALGEALTAARNYVVSCGLTAAEVEEAQRFFEALGEE